MQTTKVLLIGWDAADWQVINPLLRQGKMPALATLLSQGAHGNLVTLDPPISPMLWTSIATGKRPYKHGVLGFTDVLPDGETVAPVRVTARTCKALWNILSEKNLACHAIGWWPSHPAEKINGVCVSNFFPLLEDESRHSNAPPPADSVQPEKWLDKLAEFRVQPAELTSEILRPFFPDVDVLTSADDAVLRSCMKILAHAATIQATATHILRQTDWQFAAVYFDALDHFCHLGMKYHPPKPSFVSEVDFKKYHYIVEAAYRFHDMMLERLMSIAGPECHILLVSDHGFESGNNRLPNLPDEPGAPALEHRPYGILAASGPQINEGQVYGASLLDIAPTILNIFGLPHALDMDGEPLFQMLKNQPYTAIATYEDSVQSTREKPVENTLASSMVEQLVKLGYITNEQKANPQKVLAENQYYKARSLAHGGLLEDALKTMQALDKQYPKTERYQLFYASLLLQNGYWVKLDKWLEKNTSGTFSAYLQGMSHLKNNRWLAAQSSFEKVNNPELWVKIAAAWLEAGHAEMAEAFAKKAAEAGIDSAEVYNLSGDIYLHQEQWQEALSQYFKSLDRLYYQSRVHENVGICLMHLRMPTEAAQAMEVALMLMPQHEVIRQQLIQIYSTVLPNPKRLSELQKQASSGVVVVTGFPRSGTSMMMQMLYAGGLQIFTDAKRTSDDFNPVGYWEHQAVKNIARNQTFLKEAEGKAVKIVMPLLRILKPTMPLHVIWMKRNHASVLRSQQHMAGEGSLNLKLLQEMIQEEQLHTAWLNRHPHISYVEIDYDETLNHPSKTAEKLSRFLSKEMDFEAMVSVIEPNFKRF